MNAHSTNTSSSSIVIGRSARGAEEERGEKDEGTLLELPPCRPLGDGVILGDENPERGDDSRKGADEGDEDPH